MTCIRKTCARVMTRAYDTSHAPAVDRPFVRRAGHARLVRVKYGKSCYNRSYACAHRSSLYFLFANYRPRIA